MVKRTIIALVLFISLIGIGTYEMIAVNKIITRLDNKTAELQTLVKENENNLTVVTDSIDNLKDYWDKHEYGLYLMFNHKDLSTVTDSLSKLKSYVSSNDYDDAITEVNLLKEYTEKNIPIMGFNLQNIL